jgi:hypothetical protein
MNATHYSITLNDITKIVALADDPMSVADAMVREAGGGIPQIVPVVDAPVYSTWTEQTVDVAAKERIEQQQAALIAGGVAVNAAEQFYATGTRMAVEGYETQNARKAEHDAMTLVRDAAHQIIEMVRAEKRVDVETSAADMARGVHVNGIVSMNGLRMTETALRGICGRLQSPCLGFLLGLRERVSEELAKPEDERDMAAVRHDKETIAEVMVRELKRRPDLRFKLRTRTAQGLQDIFAAVSPSYGVADAPEALARLVDALPADARGATAYDPTTTGWELRASVWTPTPVAEQAVGEAFKGFASFRSRDNGTGRLDGGGGIELLRCLNASTYVADGVGASRIHRGAILDDVAVMVDAATAAIEVLCKAWGTKRAQAIEVPSGVPLEDAIPGFWRALLTDRSSELSAVLPGRTDHHIEGLTTAFFNERREESYLSRADFAQGWTKYIQTQGTEQRRDAERAVGAWMVNNVKPLRYVEAR